MNITLTDTELKKTIDKAEEKLNKHRNEWKRWHMNFCFFLIENTSIYQTGQSPATQFDTMAKRYRAEHPEPECPKIDLTRFLLDY
jgi:hypothetical protein